MKCDVVAIITVIIFIQSSRTDLYHDVLDVTSFLALDVVEINKDIVVVVVV